MEERAVKLSEQFRADEEPGKVAGEEDGGKVLQDDAETGKVPADEAHGAVSIFHVQGFTQRVGTWLEYAGRSAERT